MAQQVNLFNEFPHVGDVVVSFNLLCEIALAFTVLLLLVFFYNIWDLHQAQSELSRLQLETQQTQSKMLASASRLAQLMNTKQLQVTVAKLNQQLEEKRLLAAKFAGISTVNTTGFSKYLSELAQVHVDDVWLDSISLESGGLNISLHGATNDSALVKTYAGKLIKLPIYNNKPINFFSVHVKADNNKLYSFYLSTKKGNEP